MECVNHEVNKLNVTVRLCSMEEKYIINNIYPLYLHDLSEVWERKTNRYGVFENDDTRTLIEQNRVFDIWWEHPNILFPYLITVDDIPAGLAFVATSPFIPCPHYIDYYMNEFFLLRNYRGKGVGEEAVRQIFERCQGNGNCRQIQLNETNMRNVSGVEHLTHVPTGNTPKNSVIILKMEKSWSFASARFLKK